MERALRLVFTGVLLVGSFATCLPLAAGTHEGRVFAITDVERDEDHITVTLKSGFNYVALRVASLWVDGAMVSTQDGGGRSFRPGVEELLHLRLLADVARVNLTLEYERYDLRGNLTTHSETTTLDLPPVAVPRVLDALLEGDEVVVLVENPSRRNATVTVSLEDDKGFKVGSPLFRELRNLTSGEEREARFRLSEDLEQLVVVLQEGSRRDSTKVALREAGANSTRGRLTLQSDFPSREGAPGGNVEYALRLENDGAERLLELAVEGLPAGYGARFTAGGDVVPSLRVPADTVRDLRLSVTLPASAGQSAGTRLPFHALVRAEGQEVARLPLDLTIRGAGRLELQGRNWAVSTGPGQPVELEVTVANTGSAPLHEVRPEAEAPNGWEVAFEPEVLARLDPGQRQTVTLRATPPPDVGSGRYVLDLAVGTAEVSSQVRSLAVEVAPPPSNSGVLWVVAAVVAAGAGLVLVVRLRRR